jgi:hypothetical protein
VSSYLSYFADKEATDLNQVLFVAPGPAREESIRSIIDHLLPGGVTTCTFWVTHTELLADDGFIGAIWRRPEGDGDRVSILDLPPRPRSLRPIADCIGKPDWWERRPGEGPGHDRSPSPAADQARVCPPTRGPPPPPAACRSTGRARWSRFSPTAAEPPTRRPGGMNRELGQSMTKASELERNPFRPGMGLEPPYLADRPDQLQRFARYLDGFPRVSTQRSHDWARGVGKTVLRATTRSSGFLWTSSDPPPMRPSFRLSQTAHRRSRCNNSAS